MRGNEPSTGLLTGHVRANVWAKGWAKGWAQGLGPRVGQGLTGVGRRARAVKLVIRAPLDIHDQAPKITSW